MKILPISDMHGHIDVLQYIIREIDPSTYDAVTCSGDLWEGHSPNSAMKYKLVDLHRRTHKPIIITQGNHDYWDMKTFHEFPNIHMLHNDSVTIDGVKFFGTPYTPEFLNWNYMKDETSLFNMWDLKVPRDLDVMLSHGPPYGYGDSCNQRVRAVKGSRNIGSTALRRILEDRNPKYCIFGHIHSGDRRTVMENGTVCLNVSCLDEVYEFGGFNPFPKVVKLEL